MLSKGEDGRWRGFVWLALEAAGIVTYVVFAILYALTVPHGGAPDEPGHLMYVRSVADGRLPMPGTDPTVLQAADGPIYRTPQAHHPPVYYALLAPVWLISGHSVAAVYTAGRLLAVAMGLASLLLVLAAAHRLLPGRQAAIGLGAAIAGTFPTYQYVLGSLNNEAGAVLVVCLSIYLAARALQSERPWRDALLLGGCLGLGLLVKLTAAVAAVPLLVAVVVAARRRDGDLWRPGAAARLVAALALAAAISSPWFIRNQVVFGTPSFNVADRPTFERPVYALLVPYDGLAFTLTTFEELVIGTWWPHWLIRYYTPRVFALMVAGAPSERPNPLWQIFLPLAVLLTGAAGVFASWRRPRPDDPPLGPHARASLVVLVGIPVATALGLVWQGFFVDGHVMRWAPRYTPVMLPCLGLLMAMGFQRVLPRRAVLPAAVLLLLVGVGIDVAALRAVRSFHEYGPSVIFVPLLSAHPALPYGSGAPVTRRSCAVHRGPQVSVHAANPGQVGDHRHPVAQRVDFGLLVVAPAHRHLDHIQPQPQGDEDQLRVEGPALELLVREDQLDGLAREQLEAALRVLDLRAEDAALHHREHAPGHLAQ